MNPKEKAVQLFNKYYVLILEINHDLSEEMIISLLVKKQALIAVDEIIEYAERWGDMADDDIKEFKQVKTELTNL
jgi:hypothetical protein